MTEADYTDIERRIIATPRHVAHALPDLSVASRHELTAQLLAVEVKHIEAACAVLNAERVRNGMRK